MTNRPRYAYVIAVVAFLVALLLVLVDDTVDPKVVQELTLAGLAALAAGALL